MTKGAYFWASSSLAQSTFFMRGSSTAAMRETWSRLWISCADGPLSPPHFWNTLQHISSFICSATRLTWRDKKRHNRSKYSVSRVLHIFGVKRHCMTLGSGLPYSMCSYLFEIGCWHGIVFDGFAMKTKTSAKTKVHLRSHLDVKARYSLEKTDT